MRHQLIKLVKKKSTKAERVFMEILKELHIPFRAKVVLNRRERDFILFDRFVIEINGHDQCEEKNNELVQMGYTPLHFSNDEVIKHKETIKSKLLCLQEQELETY